MPHNPQSAVVVGGGIAGLWVALALHRRGVQPIVVDRDAPGSGTSVGSAGWISPVQAGPLAAPGQIAYGFRSLFDSESALHISPRFAPRILPWLWTFARHCNQRDYKAGVLAFAKLTYPSFELVDELERAQPEIGTLRRGVIVAARAPATVHHHLETLEPLRALGHEYTHELLDEDQLAEIEPFLAGKGYTGVHLEDHWAVTPRRLTDALVKELEARGVEIRVEPEGVVALERGGVRTRSGRIEGDVVVLAAGVWSAELARSAGVRLPILGGKGYTVELRGPSVPAHPILLTDAHIGCTPVDGFVRIAGTMEFSGNALAISPRRVDSLLRAAGPLIEGYERVGEAWCGLRPMTGDGLPVVGRFPGRDDLYVAAGYAMLGITVSPTAATLLADEIVEGRPHPDLEPFSPGRFARS